MNRRLALGLGLLCLLVAFASISGLIAPHELGYSKSIRKEVVDGEMVTFVAPEPPGKFFLLGSDFWGHDLLSDMIHGLPWTLGIVFVTGSLRCVIGLGIGLALGSSGGGGKRRRGFAPLSALPAFIIAAFVLFPVTINPSLPLLPLFFIQSAILVLVELGPVASSFGAKTASILAMPFIEAARLSGADKAWTVRWHILPFIFIDFLEALPIQALSVAAMIGKLGIAQLFIGGTIRSFDPEILAPARGEWLGLLGYYYDVMPNQPWLFLAPFAGWLLVLACTMLLSSGLKRSFADARGIAALKSE